MVPGILFQSHKSDDKVFLGCTSNELAIPIYIIRTPPRARGKAVSVFQLFATPPLVDALRDAVLASSWHTPMKHRAFSSSG